MADLRAILLTHIHLDHAGATGTLVHENPGLRVYVHEKGAPHLVAPEQLIASATRLWGDEMDRLWGEFRPVPEHALTILRGGERITAGGRDLDVAYTPGHASHHVSYYNADSGVAFVGDTAGIRRAERGFVLPPTPPPDIDLELWRDSLARIGRWRPATLFVTHFGPHAPAAAHLTEMAENLDLAAGLARASLGREGTDAGSGSVVYRGNPARAAQAARRGGRPGLRSGGTLRSQLARARAVLEEEGSRGS